MVNIGDVVCVVGASSVCNDVWRMTEYDKCARNNVLDSGKIDVVAKYSSFASITVLFMLLSNTMVNNWSGDMCAVVRTRKLMMTSLLFCCSLETCQLRISRLWLNELWSLNSLSICPESSLNFLLSLFLNSFCHTKPLRLNRTKKIFSYEAESPRLPLGFVIELKCASPVQKGSNEIEFFYWNVSCTVHMTYLTEKV